MQQFIEGAFSYSFPDTWKVLRFQDDDFYRKGFQRFNGGSKEADFLALDCDSNILWFLEAKDYRIYPRTKPTDLSVEVAAKFRDSLCCLEAMQIASVSTTPQRDIARLFSTAITCRFVLHLEQSVGTGLFPQAVAPANVRTKIRQLLQPLDPIAETGDAGQLSGRIPILIEETPVP
jgi:hypothetical protein